MNSKIKYALIPVGAIIPIWYVVLFAASWVQSTRPRTYGEDLTGFGVLLLPVLAFLSVIPALLFGSIVYFVVWLIRKDRATTSVWVVLCTTAYWLVSIPVLVSMSKYVIADF